MALYPDFCAIARTNSFNNINGSSVERILCIKRLLNVLPMGGIASSRNPMRLSGRQRWEVVPVMFLHPIRMERNDEVAEADQLLTARSQGWLADPPSLE
jgi:hypothetical protein